MKYNFPLLNNNNTSIFQKYETNIFYQEHPRIIPYINNNFNILPSKHLGIWNTYQNLYNQIISKDKKEINSSQSEKKNIIKFQTSLNKKQVILNEDIKNNSESNNLNNMENKLNNNNSLLGNKRNTEKINDINNISTNNENFGKKNKRGRKKKHIIIKGNHTKFTDDNIIRKIKCHFLNYINENLNKNLIDKNNFFFKLDNYINENLKKDYNIQLMHRTLKEIYIDTKISNKYKKHESDINKKLIEKIYFEKKESEVIKILEQSYIETFNELIKTNLDNFCNGILRKEEKNGLSKNDAVNYFKDIKQLCENYEKWFECKKGRSKKNNNKALFN